MTEGEALVATGQCGVAELERDRTANVAFHGTILAAARNRQLAHTLCLARNRPGAWLRRIVAFAPGKIRRCTDDHRCILDAITTQDP